MRVRLTFSGVDFVIAGINRGALKIGNYQLDIDGSKILSVAGNQTFDGDLDGIAGGHKLFGYQEVDKFYAMFGDVSGTRAVGAAENNAFRRSYSGIGPFDARFDSDGNGVLGAADLNELRRSMAKLRLIWN